MGLELVELIFNLVKEAFQQPTFQNGLAFVGLAWTTFYILNKTLKAVNAVRLHLIPTIFETRKNWLKFGKWAVVTGSTDGIGKEFARQLASLGLNIILISRNPEKLQKVADEITREFNVKTRTFPINFSDAVLSTYKKLEDELKRYDIGLLVNNVGVFVPYPMPFDSLPQENAWDHVVVNCGATTMMTRIILPQMKQRKRGGMIVNISSAGALGPVPLCSSYSASKVYTDYFTEALRQENEKHGIEFLNLTPFFMATNMVQCNELISKPSFFTLRAKDYVKSALRTFGRVEKTTGCFPHAIQRGLFEISPCVFTWLVNYSQNILWEEGLQNEKNKTK